MGLVKLTVEGALISNVVNKQDAHRTTVVCCRDRSKPLLACADIPKSAIVPTTLHSIEGPSIPAVSQICSFTRFPSSSIVLILKSIPIVVMKLGVKLSSLNRSRQHDLPTPESPIKRSFI